MKGLLLLSCVILFTVSCKEKVEPQPGVVLKFYPRQCNYTWLKFLKQTSVAPNGQAGYVLEEISGNECKVGDLRLSLFTSNINNLPDDGYYSAISGPYAYQRQLAPNLQQLDEPDLLLEKQLSDDFLRSLKSASAVKDDLLAMEYRTTGISEIAITCNQPLFGQVAGTLLNSSFHIADINPHQIISHQSRTLIFGFSDKLNKMSIDEWIELKPMAQPSMHLMMNALPAELPVTCRFIVAIKTVEGKVIEATSPEITLLP
jgi:hypothetical protein